METFFENILLSYIYKSLASGWQYNAIISLRDEKLIKNLRLGCKKYFGGNLLKGQLEAVIERYQQKLL